MRRDLLAHLTEASALLWCLKVSKSAVCEGLIYLYNGSEQGAYHEDDQPHLPEARKTGLNIPDLLQEEHQHLHTQVNILLSVMTYQDPFCSNPPPFFTSVKIL